MNIPKAKLDELREILILEIGQENVDKLSEDDIRKMAEFLITVIMTAQKIEHRTKSNNT